MATDRILDPRNIGEIEENISKSQFGDLYQLHHRVPGRSILRSAQRPNSLDFSLAGQLDNILEFQPEVLLFTAFSAIPMADVFRGIYAHLQVLATPTMASVTVRKSAPFKRPETREAERLHVLVEGKRVGVVDQYIFSGKSVLSGIRIAQFGGASATLPILGRWYSDTDMDTVDVANVSSIYSAELQDIGERLAAARKIAS